MNIYVCIRMILHSLLFLVNLFALTIAAWIVVTSKGQSHKATAGSVLVILSTIFYAFTIISIWSETCISRSKFSRNGTEAVMLPILFLFQIITAIVTTADATGGTCRDSQSTCVALLILSWMSAFALLIYYLINMIVIFYHFPLNESIFTESPLTYDWFPMLPSKRDVPPPIPKKDLNDTNPTRNSPTAEVVSVKPSHPSFYSQSQHQRSPSLDFESKLRAYPTVDSRQQTRHATWNRFSQNFDGLSFQPTPPPEGDEEGGSRLSLSIPRWARKLRPLKRGVELPFPVAATSSSLHTFTTRKLDSHMHSIDAPVTPTIYVE